MGYITYKGKKYKTRTFEVLVDGDVRIHKIAVESLYEAMKPNIDGWDEREIDNKIYYYVKDLIIKRKAELICMDDLDFVMEFIKEII